MAVGLVRDVESKLACLFPYLGLVEIADRKHRVRELRLVEREQEVRLILGRIRSALQAIPAGRRIQIHARVMAGRDEVRAHAFGPGDEGRELQVAVAVHARNRRPAGGVLVDEVGDDRIARTALEIDDVVGDADACGDAAGVVEVVNRAAGAEADAASRSE